uniref:Uncharacterized protein n=1 Tax=Setaria italica TaxID=4555 RepID=K3ZYX9_SETIT
MQNSKGTYDNHNRTYSLPDNEISHSRLHMEIPFALNSICPIKIGEWITYKQYFVSGW